MKESEKESRTGLCIGGGGITGTMYTVGVLAALEDAFPPFRASDFDVFVASGEGAPVAMALAGGLGAKRLYRALLDPADDLFPLRRQHLLHLDSKEIRRVIGSITGAARRMIGQFAAKPLETDLWHELDRYWDALPGGLFSLDTFEAFLSDFAARRGIPARFDELRRTLLVVATDLDRGERAVFGKGHIEDVSVQRAVCAACAIPVLFTPVRIGDGDYIATGPGEQAHADLAVDEGCERILVINPMVPVRHDPKAAEVPTGRGPRKRVRDKGLLWVHSQSFRVGAAKRLELGMEEFRKRHPSVDIQVVEPDRDASVMFMHSPMNFAARRVILEDGYTAHRRRLADPKSELRRAFEAQGFEHQAPGVH